MLDMQLDVKDGMLDIECHYPTEADLEQLPQVWLTNSNKTWDHCVLDIDDGFEVISYWDGPSEFLTRFDIHQQATYIDGYVLNNQAADFMIDATKFLAIGGLIFKTFNEKIHQTIKQISDSIIKNMTR
mmetsp:Transcript_34411/g.48876  ORF Transcript_34411/g.48876 Transcript_34411/m.48876 type:complete len:128 (+) Transcript_34411:134-517(+)